MRRWVIPALAVLNLGLLIVLASMWVTPSGQWVGVHWVPPAALRPALDGDPGLPETGVEVSRFVATLERPLFVASRRPPPPPLAASAPLPPDPFPDLKLIAVYGNKDSGGIIVRLDGRARRMKLGDAINGWTLQSLRPNAAELAQAGDTRTIEIKRTMGNEPMVANAASTTAAVPAVDAAQQRERDQRRAALMRMNALRAQMGVPPLAE